MRLSGILVSLGVTLPAPASATVGGEAIRLIVEAPPECLTEEQLLAGVESLGTRVRLADESERARTFDVTIGREGGHFVVRLVLRDLVGRETVRSVETQTCADAGRSASLLVSLALDEEPERAPRARDPERFLLPAGPAEDFQAPPKASRLGSGGVVVMGTYGERNGRDGTDVYGVRTYAAWRRGITRFGAAVTLQRDEDVGPQPIRGGTTLRTGGIIGWGAPWNDSIAGFIGEVGVAAGEIQRREASAGSRMTMEAFASPYAAGWLILQVPWKYAVRPVVGVGSVWTAFGFDLPVTFAANVGIAWQAW